MYALEGAPSPFQCRVAVTNYLNSLPFRWGLAQRFSGENATVEAMEPALCARYLAEGKAHLALVPTGTLSTHDVEALVTRFCIGSNGSVGTVVLCSQTPIERIERVFLDTHSRTSVRLLKLLAARYWLCNWRFEPLRKESLPDIIADKASAVLLIGDRVFQYALHWRFCTDLGQAWYDYTKGLPFIYAAWRKGSNFNELGPEASGCIAALDAALAYGLSHRQQALDDSTLPNFISTETAAHYINERISYERSEPKMNGLRRFLDSCEELGI